MPRPIQSFEADGVLKEFGLDSSELPGVYTYGPEPDPRFDIKLYPEEFSIALGNRDLPVYEHKDAILRAVRDNSVTIIVAETGVGKSTQIPMYLLEQGEYRNIYLTQPRRTPTQSLFNRIDSEILGEWGDDGRDLVNYKTAGSTEGHKDAPIQIVTDGIQVARELGNSGFKENDVLIVDEAHEWNSNMEILVAAIKIAIDQNPNLRVVIMSASIDSDHLASFYDQISGTRPAIINIEGRRHRIEASEEPESTVVDEVMRAIISIPKEDGAIPEGYNGILAFTPGKREIQDAIKSVHSRLPKDIAHKVKVFPLHAKLSEIEQQEALMEYPGYIKVVFSTDVAQTSITIPDIKYVVDSGCQKRIEEDGEGTRSLKLVPISNAESIQRRGRTGRVDDGVYISTRLNESTPYVWLEEREPYPIPEILRTDASRNTLRLKCMGYDIENFDFYHMPSEASIARAKENLRLLGAFDEEDELTELGQRINKYPASTSSARIMAESERYQPAIRTYLAAIIAAKEAGGLKYYSSNVGKRWEDLTDELESDFMVHLDLFIAAQYMDPSMMREYDLDIDNFKRALEQYQKIARIAGTEPTDLRPPTEKERGDILNCVYTGYLPFIYKRVDTKEYVHAFRPLPTSREISNRSCVKGSPAFLLGDPYAIELFDDESRRIKHSIENVTSIDHHKLGAFAVGHVVWKHEEFVMRQDEGKMRERKRQYLFGVALDVVEEVPVEASPQTRQAIIEYSLANGGYAQKKLRKIKETLEQLQRRARGHVPQLTQETLLALINEAASANITNPSEIEDNLQIMMNDPTRGLSLNDFISAEQQEEITKNSPDSIKHEGTRITLGYERKGKRSVVFATRYNPNKVLGITEVPTLPDGRIVLFARVGEAKKYTLHELQEKIREDQSRR